MPFRVMRNGFFIHRSIQSCWKWRFKALHLQSSRMKSASSRTPRLRPRMRVLCGEDIALGPGKVHLLALIDETGSIREAAERMGMSYMRAWTLIRMMNACFKEPLVVAVRGGGETRAG